VNPSSDIASIERREKPNTCHTKNLYNKHYSITSTGQVIPYDKAQDIQVAQDKQECTMQKYAKCFRKSVNKNKESIEKDEASSTRNTSRRNSLLLPIIIFIIFAVLILLIFKSLSVFNACTRQVNRLTSMCMDIMKRQEQMIEAREWYI
jgi:hypothetical protein